LWCVGGGLAAHTWQSPLCTTFLFAPANEVSSSSYSGWSGEGKSAWVMDCPRKYQFRQKGSHVLSINLLGKKV
ncbi:hypothetical protein NDU88_010379, partial [Pleurodeles waltl]